MSETLPLFHPVEPGAGIPGDWYPGIIPRNIEVGAGAVTDSSFCFKHFFSRLDIGLRLGANATLWRTGLAAEPEGLIEIGDDCYICNASIVCSENIRIGNRVFIAGGVTIADSDFHPLAPAARMADTIALSPVARKVPRPQISARAVVIGDDVWIGYNATILKGVTIGSGAVIHAGALVIENVAAGCEVSGNPAKPILSQP